MRSVRRKSRKASKICPSCNSPSPVNTMTSPLSFKNFLLHNIPFAFEIPIPNEPVLASTPGILTSACPSKPFSFLKLRIFFNFT